MAEEEQRKGGGREGNDCRRVKRREGKKKQQKISSKDATMGGLYMKKKSCRAINHLAGHRPGQSQMEPIHLVAERTLLK
jgi:hypothetical protein